MGCASVGPQGTPSPQVRARTSAPQAMSALRLTAYGAAHEPAPPRADRPRRRCRGSDARRGPGRFLPARHRLPRRQGPGSAQGFARAGARPRWPGSSARACSSTRCTAGSRSCGSRSTTCATSTPRGGPWNSPAWRRWSVAVRPTMSGSRPPFQSMTEASNAGDGRAAVAADAAFHLAIVASTSSRRLRTAAEAALRELRIVLAVADRVSADLDDLAADHLGLLDALGPRAPAVRAGRAARPPAPRRVARARGHPRRLAAPRRTRGSSPVDAGRRRAAPRRAGRRRAPPSVDFVALYARNSTLAPVRRRARFGPALERRDGLAVAADLRAIAEHRRLVAQHPLERGPGTSSRWRRRGRPSGGLQGPATAGRRVR